jgi:hypothetical protein
MMKNVKLIIIIMIIIIILKYLLLLGVPGFDGHLENGNGYAGLQPATGSALSV